MKWGADRQSVERKNVRQPPNALGNNPENKQKDVDENVAYESKADNKAETGQQKSRRKRGTTVCGKKKKRRSTLGVNGGGAGHSENPEGKECRISGGRSVKIPRGWQKRKTGLGDCWEKDEVQRCYQAARRMGRCPRVQKGAAKENCNKIYHKKHSPYTNVRSLIKRFQGNSGGGGGGVCRNYTMEGRDQDAQTFLQRDYVGMGAGF